MGYTAILPSDWLRWRDEGGELPSRPVMLVFDDGYEEMALVGFPILLRHGFTAACMIVTSCIGGTNRWDEEAGRPSFRMMSSEQILGWSQKGIEFGSHTSTHPELPFETEERVELEFARSKEELSTILNKQPVAFSYPFGSLSVAAQTAVRRHFRIGFTSWPGRLHLATDPALAPRIAFLPGESRFGMWCRLRLGRNPMEVARNRWKRMLGRSNHD
jgi:peptidoglycan/xylan/chitin deacetylase (PgdA/CDA1 family)